MRLTVLSVVRIGTPDALQSVDLLFFVFLNCLRSPRSIPEFLDLLFPIRKNEKSGRKELYLSVKKDKFTLL